MENLTKNEKIKEFDTSLIKEIEKEFELLEEEEIKIVSVKEKRILLHKLVEISFDDLWLLKKKR